MASTDETAVAKPNTKPAAKRKATKGVPDIAAEVTAGIDPAEDIERRWTKAKLAKAVAKHAKAAGIEPLRVQPYTMPPCDVQALQNGVRLGEWLAGLGELQETVRAFADLRFALERACSGEGFTVPASVATAIKAGLAETLHVLLEERRGEREFHVMVRRCNGQRAAGEGEALSVALNWLYSGAAEPGTLPTGWRWNWNGGQAGRLLVLNW